MAFLFLFINTHLTEQFFSHVLVYTNINVRAKLSSTSNKFYFDDLKLTLYATALKDPLREVEARSIASSVCLPHRLPCVASR